VIAAIFWRGNAEIARQIADLLKIALSLRRID